MSSAANRAFESFRVGEEASFLKEITAEEIERFAQISGDWNPLHMEPEVAARTRYGKRLAHGLLVAAPISTLAGHLLPGKRCLLLEVRCRFLQPVFIADRLTYRAVITHLSTGTQVMKVQVKAMNQNGTVVMEGSYQGQVLPESEGDE